MAAGISLRIAGFGEPRTAAGLRLASAAIGGWLAACVGHERRLAGGLRWPRTAAGLRLALAANGGRDFPVNRGLHFAADGGTGLRTQVELRRIKGVLGLGRRSEPLGRYVEVLSRR